MKNVSATDFRDFVNAYMETALWSSNDESTPSGGEPLDKNYDADDISESTKKEMEGDCIRFLELADAANLLEAIDSGSSHGESGWAMAGHDFWLTRNGHGAGFWDGDWGDSGDALTEICKKFGEYNLYVGDDGEIYG